MSGRTWQMETFQAGIFQGHLTEEALQYKEQLIGKPVSCFVLQTNAAKIFVDFLQLGVLY